MHGCRLRRRLGALTTAWAFVLLPMASARAAILDVVISELMYHAPGADNEGEYLELTNRGLSNVNLTGWSLQGGIQFSFPANTQIPIGGRLVIAKTPSVVQTVYGISGVLGPYTGELSNSGEKIEIRDNNTGLVHEVIYNDKAPWPTGGDGDGRSIELTDLNKNGNVGRFWLPSSKLLGTPGAANSPAADRPVTVVINEFLANSSTEDWIELYNYGDQAVDLNGYYLTDNPANPTKAQINAGWTPGTTIIPAKGYWVSRQSDWGFGLSSSGEQVYLVGPDGMTWVDGYDFSDHLFEDVTEGRLPGQGDRWYKFISPTQGSENLPPTNHGVIINEIMYHPAGSDPGPEFIELRNTSGTPVSIAGWILENGIDFEFPVGATIPASGYVVIAADPSLVQSTYGIGGVYGPYDRVLSNFSDEIELKDHLGNRVDFAEYRQEGLWPESADGGGPSLERIHPSMATKLPGAWQASVGNGTPGAANSRNVTNPAASVDRVSHSPLTPLANQPVTVTALVDAGNLTSVRLYYKHDNDGSFSSNIEMFDDGQHGDGLAGDKVYGATLPGRSNDDIIEFYVDAQATGGNATFPAGAPSQTCLYVVEDGPPTNSNLNIFWLILTNERVNSLMSDPNNDTPRDCTFIFGNDVYYNAGIRFRSGARGGPKYSYKVKLPPGYRFRGADVFNLNFEKADGTHLKNKVINHFLEYMNIPEAQTEFIHTRWRFTNAGVHLYAEAHDEDYLENHFPGDSDGNLYKGVAPFVTQRDGKNIAWGGNHGWYEKESNEAQNDWSDIDNLYSVMRPGTSDATYEQNVRNRIDVVNWARAYAVLGTCTLIDTPWHIHNQNYRLYRRFSDDRFVHVLYDFDDGYWPSMWNNAGTNQTVYEDVNRFLSWTAFKREHLHAYWVALNPTTGVYRKERIMAEVEYYHDLIFDDVADDPFSGLANGSKWAVFSNAVNQWNNWLTIRNSLLYGMLPSASFNITTNGGNPVTTGSPNFTLDGTIPISAATVRIEGLSAAPQWTTTSSFRFNLTLVNQNNTLKVQTLDDDGNVTDERIFSVTYTNGIPNGVDFTTGAIPQSPPYTVQFFDASTAPNVSGWTWDFGDGGVSSVQNPQHTFATWGTFDVQLEIQATGGPFSITKPVDVGVPIPSDFDQDGDVDLSDFGMMQTCLTAPGEPQLDPACQAMRLDIDQDVDQDDLALFLSCISGAGIPAAPNCP